MKYILFTILAIFFALIIIDINLNIKYSIFVDETMDHTLYKRIFSFFYSCNHILSIHFLFSFFSKRRKYFIFLSLITLSILIGGWAFINATNSFKSNIEREVISIYLEYFLLFFISVLLFISKTYIKIKN